MEPDPEKVLAMIRGIRTMKDPDPEDVLAVIAEIRNQLPTGQLPPREPRPELDPRLDGVTDEEFAWETVQEALESLVAEMEALNDARRQKLLDAILDMYYGMEEAIRDPANAHLIPHVEKLRAAYFRDYGRPIPTKEETEARRRKG